MCSKISYRQECLEAARGPEPKLSRHDHIGVMTPICARNSSLEYKLVLEEASVNTFKGNERQGLICSKVCMIVCNGDAEGKQRAQCSVAYYVVHRGLQIVLHLRSLMIQRVCRLCMLQIVLYKHNLICKALNSAQNSVLQHLQASLPAATYTTCSLVKSLHLNTVWHALAHW